MNINALNTQLIILFFPLENNKNFRYLRIKYFDLKNDENWRFSFGNR